MAEIEVNLELLGATAIEDKLQDGVPAAIASIMAAGVKVWVLTGDKEETAINIGVACQLLWAEDRMDRLVINLRSNSTNNSDGTATATAADIEALLDSKLAAVVAAHDAYDKRKLDSSSSAGDEEEDATTSGAPLPLCLVIDGPALLEAMRTPSCQRALLRYAQACHSVVGCRVTPDQKRAMVALVRRNVPGSRTLAIGDGANDVPMIQGAHIGVGISGQEGMQAVNASDYAIAQFRFLAKLMLTHGRWNYRRSSRVVCFLFYKSVLFAVPLFYYAFYNGFSGALFFDYVSTNLYAVVFTALPILLYGIYDQDVSAPNCLRFPQMYSSGIQDTWLSPAVFWSWMLQALAEGVWFTLMPLYFLTGGRGTAGLSSSLLLPGSATFCLVVLAASLKMVWVQCRWSWIHALALLVSCGLWFLCSLAISALLFLNWDFYGVSQKLLVNPNFWLTVLWCAVGVVARDLTWKLYHRWWSPALHHVLLEHESCKLIPPDLEDMGAPQGGAAGTRSGQVTPLRDDKQQQRVAVAATAATAASGGGCVSPLGAHSKQGSSNGHTGKGSSGGSGSAALAATAAAAAVGNGAEHSRGGSATAAAVSSDATTAAKDAAGASPLPPRLQRHHSRASSSSVSAAAGGGSRRHSRRQSSIGTNPRKTSSTLDAVPAVFIEPDGGDEEQTPEGTRRPSLLRRSSASSSSGLLLTGRPLSLRRNSVSSGSVGSGLLTEHSSRSELYSQQLLQQQEQQQAAAAAYRAAHWSPQRRNSSAPSALSGFAFSTDTAAQAAEIAMILGKPYEPAGHHHSSSASASIESPASAAAAAAAAFRHCRRVSMAESASDRQRALAQLRDGSPVQPLPLTPLARTSSAGSTPVVSPPAAAAVAVAAVEGGASPAPVTATAAAAAVAARRRSAAAEAAAKDCSGAVAKVLHTLHHTDKSRTVALPAAAAASGAEGLETTIEDAGYCSSGDDMPPDIGALGTPARTAARGTAATPPAAAAAAAIAVAALSPGVTSDSAGLLASGTSGDSSQQQQQQQPKRERLSLRQRLSGGRK
jgi:Phospholipid-translocating P-type ATPase C-terminal